MHTPFPRLVKGVFAFVLIVVFVALALALTALVMLLASNGEETCLVVLLVVAFDVSFVGGATVPATTLGLTLDRAMRVEVSTCRRC